MSLLDQQKETLKAVHSEIEGLLQVKLADLTREEQLGTLLNFKICEPQFQLIINLLNKLTSTDISGAPYYMLKDLLDQLRKTKQTYETIFGFSPSGANPADQRNQIIVRIDKAQNDLFVATFPVLTQATVLNANNDDILNKLSNAYVELDDLKKKSNEAAVNILKEMEIVLSKARTAALEVGISQHNKIFQDEATEHETLAKTWLNWTTIVLIIIFIIGIALLFIPIENKEVPFLVHFTLTKIVMLTVMFYALAICSRNYKAHKHNAILNKHRQNALKTFETFTKAAGDDTQTKNAVLLEATRTIFSSQATGYISSENDGDSPNKIIEIIKSTTSRN